MIDPIDLNPNHLARVRAILAEHVPECEVRAFSSRVTWTAKDYSDLDLAVVGKGPLDWRTLGRLKEAFEESDLPIRVDVLDWHSILESFRKVIEQDYVILWDGERQTTENKWCRHDVSALIDEEILVIGDGYRAKNTELSREGIPFARAGNIRDGFQFSDADHFPKDQLHKVGEKISRSGDTVFTSKGTVGRFAFVTDDTPRFVYSPQLSFWRSLNPTVLEPRFLHYWMAGREFFAQYKSVAGQTDMAEYVSLRDQRQMSITLPPLTEQRTIAHVLGTLDDKIELNRRMNETLEAMARALFKSWFVEFDPVRAKIEGRWRRGDSLPGLPAEHYDLFPDRLVPSELGKIPEGWGVKPLGDVAEQRREGVRPELIDPDTPYIALEHMPKRCIALCEWDTADGLASSKFKFEQGDILFGKLRPYFHKVGVAPLDGVCSTDIVVVTPKSHDWFGFVLGHISSSEFVDYTDAGATGTKMPRTKWADMANYKIPLPDTHLAEVFTGLIRPWVIRIVSTAIHESRILASQRDALLPPLVSGNVRVEKCEKIGSSRTTRMQGDPHGHETSIHQF